MIFRGKDCIGAGKSFGIEVATKLHHKDFKRGMDLFTAACQIVREIQNFIFKSQLRKFCLHFLLAFLNFVIYSTGWVYLNIVSMLQREVSAGDLRIIGKNWQTSSAFMP